MKTVFLLLTLVLCFVFASEKRARPEGLHKPKSPPGWRVTEESVSRDHVVEHIMIALKQRNGDALERLLFAVSDPLSPKYGQHATIEDITKLVQPREETTNVVMEFIASAGLTVTRTFPNGDWIEVSGTVEALEKALGITYSVHRHSPSEKTAVGSLDSYSVPRSVAMHIDAIIGATGLPTVRSTRTATSSKRQVNPPVTPAVLRERYNVTVVGGKSAKTLQAVAEFQGQYYSPADLQEFFTKYVPNNKNYTVRQVIGQNDPSAPGIEASLDIQYIMGVAPNVPTDFYIYPSMNFWGGLTSWITALNAQKNPPQVSSVSYGDQSFDQPSNTVKDRLNKEFIKAGSLGMTIVFASGDSGTGCDFCVYLQPSFPATSPYVTSVGATRFENGKVGPEMAVEEFHSGGGFSWDFSRPSYQDAAVTEYFKREAGKLPFWFQYNSKGRATPDIAALGIGFQVIVGGAIDDIGGTSASAPTASAILSLINDERFAAGKSSLGFLNPLIYSTWANSTTTHAFYDVTKGTNSDFCCFTGFECAVGYDPDTGVGTLNFAVLKKLWV